MAFVVPAEIGHAPYAKPVIEYLAEHFEKVQVIAVREKMFPDLSEDCWLLYAEGFGGRTDHIFLSSMRRFRFMETPPTSSIRVTITEWEKWNRRLRPFLLPSQARDFYQQTVESRQSVRLGEVAKVGIGYVTGNNGFFHLRPSEARLWGIPEELLQPTIRNGKMLTGRAVTPEKVQAWRRHDEPNFLLRLRAGTEIPTTVLSYLDSAGGRQARTTYKCRNREPWYVVPDIVIPDGFLAYMSGVGPALVANHANCSGTNSVHMVIMTGAVKIAEVQKAWETPFTKLSCEVEGHPLGGGMLKIEPREAGRVVLTREPMSMADQTLIQEGISTMQGWRHCG
jgi:hypothetical protein